MSKFGDRLREIRKGAGLTLDAVANHLQVSISYVSNVERGRAKPLSLWEIHRFSDLLKDYEIFNELVRYKNASSEYYCFKAENLGVDTCVLLDSLLRNLSDHVLKAKTETHPIIKHFIEVLNVIYMGGK